MSVVDFFLRWRWVTRNRTERRKSPHIRSVRETPVFSLYHLNKIQRITFNADEKLIRCICECIFNTLKGNVSLERCEKNQLTKYKKALRHVVAKLGNGRIKESCWCSEADFYLIIYYYIILSYIGSILSILYIINYRKNEIIGIKCHRED